MNKSNTYNDMEKVLKHIEFVRKGKLKYNPPKLISSFYQICQFKDPYTKKYETRKIIFNEHGDILKTYKKSYDKTELNKFIEINKNKINKYRIYPTTSIDNVAPLNTNEMNMIQSELINNDCVEYTNKIIN